jgi:Mg2+ and Co2+ transporter CorA
MMDVIGNDLSDHHSREQASHGNRLAAIFSIFLLPTFVVGLYGMNIDSSYFPEFGLMNGYLFAGLLILVLSVGQGFLFKKLKWL